MYFNGTKCCSLVIGCLLSLSLGAKEAKTAGASGVLVKPLCFVENKGQLTDQNNKSRTDIQYQLATPGMTLFVGHGQLHYQFKKTANGESDKPELSVYRMDVTLLGANKNAKVIASEGQEYLENYYLANAGANGITAHSWNKITYKDIYPFIDWVLYVKGDKVEYDFVVNEGGNVNDIQLQYGGANSLSLTKDGGIAAITPMGTVEEKTPVAFENRSGKAVATNFKLKNNVVSFETGSHNGAITIDPILLWSTYFGGTGQDVVTSLSTIQSPGLNTYVGGYTTSSGIATTGSFQVGFAATQDAFLAKYNNAGVVQFVTYFGGNGITKGTSVALDNGANNVYLAGYTNSPAFGLTTPGAYHNNNNGLNDGFLIKFNNSGARQWCTFYGGTQNDYINGVAVDGSNNVYITGQTASNALIATGGAYQTTLNGTNDACLAKFNSSGNIQFSTYYGGAAQDQAFAITCDALGNIDIAGQTNSAVTMYTTGAYQTALSGSNDAFVAQFSSAGVRRWGTYFGGTATEQANAIASDAAGNIAVVGNTTSTGAIATPKAFQTTYGGVQDAFVAYFNNSGAMKWSSYLGGTALDFGQAVCFDLLGNVVVAGGAFSTTGVATVNSLQPAIGGDYDAYVAKINQLGQTIWSTYFGGLFYDYANAVGYDQTGQLVLAGYTSSNGNYPGGGISTVASAQAANAGGIYDAFISKFRLDTLVSVASPFTDTLVCAGGNLSVDYTVTATGNNFKTGNIFSVQLSGPTGSFATPTTIGSLAATGSGTINCTIPLAASGTGYRIRIVATNPAFISPDDYLDIKVVASLPATYPTATSPSCVGGTVNFNDTAAFSVDAYSWTGPGGFTSAIQNPTLTSVALGNAGTYSVTTSHNGCPNGVATVPVVINNVYPPIPTATVAAACAGSTISLNANPDTTATGLHWHWSGPSGFTSSLQNPTISGATASNAGTYYVTDTLAGCPSPIRSVVVTVNPTIAVAASIIATPGYTIGNPGDTICLGTMVNFTASVINGGSSPTYQWYAGGVPVVGAITNTWSSATLTDGENIQCIINSSVLCPSPANAGSNIIKMNVLENAPLVYISATPGAHVTPGSTVTFTSSVYNAGIGPKYQWYKNGTAVAGATNATFILMGVNAPDSVTLKVTSTMMCALPDSVATSNMIVAESNVGVTHLSAALSAIGLFPNPNNGSFTIKGSLVADDAVMYDVTNLLGQVVASGNLTVQNNELDHTISLHNISDGIYLLRLQQNGQNKVFRFSVQRN